DAVGHSRWRAGLDCDRHGLKLLVGLDGGHHASQFHRNALRIPAFDLRISGPGGGWGWFGFGLGFLNVRRSGGAAASCVSFGSRSSAAIAGVFFLIASLRRNPSLAAWGGLRGFF